MDPKPHAKKLPEGYSLKSEQTLEGRKWEVRRISDGKGIAINQKTPKIAVDRALAAISES